MALSREELEDVYRRRYEGFRCAIGALTGDDQLAHDAVQEGFARALRKRRQCRGASPEAWVWRIVLNSSRDLRRRHEPRPETVRTELVASQRDPLLAAAIRRLPPRRRLIVFLRYFGDLSYAEIAEACRISEGTVGAALAAAHAQLAAALQPEGVDA